MNATKTTQVEQLIGVFVKDQVVYLNADHLQMLLLKAGQGALAQEIERVADSVREQAKR